LIKKKNYIIVFKKIKFFLHDITDCFIVALPPMEAFSLLRNWRGGGDGDTAIGSGVGAMEMVIITCALPQLSLLCLQTVRKLMMRMMTMMSFFFLGVWSSW
jgi:hypothetical protein